MCGVAGRVFQVEEQPRQRLELEGSWSFLEQDRGRLERVVAPGNQRPLGPGEEQRPQGRAEEEVNTQTYIIK